MFLNLTSRRLADADRCFEVIGCDGIHSRTRELLLGEDHLASRPSYTNKVAYRGLVPISGGIAALGEDKGNNQCSHMGPDAHILSFPVSVAPKSFPISRDFSSFRGEFARVLIRFAQLSR